jgi:hypothetical protein
MADSFNHEARAFLASYEELALEEQTDWHLPEKDTPRWNLVRRMIGQAEWLAGNLTNPLHDFDPAQRVVMNFAQDFLRWAADPSMPRWGELFRSRHTVRQVEDFYGRHE